jgi:hydrogenase nickel incorporation protein HypA/HybF
VLRIIEQAAVTNNLPRIRKVVLEIGQFSGVEVHALELAFSALCRGTVLEGADIEYQTPPLLLLCRDCRAEYVGEAADLRCPACEGEHYQVLQGRELIVKSIVVEA